jgi:Tfp pilus assembly protein PilN
MRSINLLPSRYQPTRASGDRPGIGYAALGALAVVFLMVLLYVLTNNGINDAHDKTAKAQAEQQQAAARVGQLQAYGDFASLKVSREDAVKRVASVRFDYERLMREIALVLPHNTYLTAFTSGAGGSAAAPAPSTTTTGASGTTSATGPSVTIGACAPSHPGVATAIVRLRKLHNVTDVNLTSSSKQGAAASATGGTTNACPVAWAATLTFQAETAPTVQEPVPARLGGGQ